MADQLARPRVLLVDDELLNRKTFGRAFRREYDICTTHSGVEALALLRQVSFDVIFIDFCMDDMDGIELARQARLLRPRVACVMLTGYPDSPEVQAASAEGILDAVLCKPWRRDDIEKWVSVAQSRSPS